MTIISFLYTKVGGLFARAKRFIFLRWNQIRLKILGVKYGKRLRILNRVYLKISRGGVLSIGDNFVFTSDDAINPLSRNLRGCIMVPEGGIISIGDHVGMSSVSLRCHKRITIGNYVQIGADTIIMDSDAHSLNYKDRKVGTIDMQHKIDKPIVIEDDVLIGARCIILKGVTIGARSIIGSGSVVTKSIPADCIAAGNPCKVIRYINE